MKWLHLMNLATLLLTGPDHRHLTNCRQGTKTRLKGSSLRQSGVDAVLCRSNLHYGGAHMPKQFLIGDTEENPDQKPPALGGLIRDGRRDRGLTQGELARGICSRPYVSQIEKGTRFPAPVIMKHLAHRLDLPLGHFAPSYILSPMADVEQCLGFAKIQAKSSSPEEARRSYEWARELHRRQGCPAGVLPALREALGIIMLYERRFEECEAILKEVLEGHIKTGTPTGSLAETCIALAISYSHRGKLQRATPLLQKAFNIVFAMGAPVSPAHAAWTKELQEETVEWLMRVFVLQRRYHTARTICEWAATTWGSGRDDDVPPRIVMLRATADLGTGNSDAAETSLLHLLDSSARALDPFMSAALHNNLAVTYRLKRHWERAQYHATMALDIWRRHSDRIPGHHISNELAYASLALGDLQQARRALDLSGTPYMPKYQTPDPVFNPERLLLEARLALAQGDPETARNFLYQAEEATGGVFWVEMLVHVEMLQTDFDSGATADEKQARLNILRATIENRAV